jgi:copper homeostasis protein
LQGRRVTAGWDAGGGRECGFRVNMGKVDLEICVDSVESAMAAACGGAQRVELCSALGEGGVTPSAGLIRAVRDAIPIDIFLIIRPRVGDFHYTDHDFAVMRDDIRDAKSLGVNGVALGLLTAGGRVHVERTRSLVELARPMQVTFHRAFDLTPDLDEALEDVIACGAERILTSGGEANAVRGMDRIGQLRERAGDRIRIMAGGGIRRSNVRRLAERTGVCDIHTSLSNTVHSDPPNGHGRVRIGSRPGENARFLVTEEDVRAIHDALHALSNGRSRGEGAGS